jgi:hypothetical protein
MRLRFVFFIIEAAPFTYPHIVRCNYSTKGVRKPAALPEFMSGAHGLAVFCLKLSVVIA